MYVCDRACSLLTKMEKEVRCIEKSVNKILGNLQEERD